MTCAIAESENLTYESCRTRNAPLEVIPRNRAVFVDRDGVLNEVSLRDGKPFPPALLDEVRILPGVKEACISLKAAGFLLILVTNQPDIARRRQSRDVVDSINQLLKSELHLDDVKVCPHDDSDECQCRKPRPGMLLEAAGHWRVDLSRSFMVGDRWRDVEAGLRAGCRTVWIDRQYQERQPSQAHLVTGDLKGAVPWILGSIEESPADRTMA